MARAVAVDAGAGRLRDPRLVAHAGAMTRGQIHERVVAILARLIPGIHPELLAPDASLRAALAADSMDVLNFVTALHDELGVDVPEDDYPRLDTLEGCVEYVDAALDRKAGSRPSG